LRVDTSQKRAIRKGWNLKKRLQTVLALALMGGAAFLGWRYWRAHRFDAAIAAASKRYQLEPALIRAVIWRESGFNPRARGRAGELGLMQIRETAALEWASAEHIRGFDHAACLNPLTNVLAGSWYLKNVLRHYSQADDPLPFGLAEYNAGRGNVLKWLAGGGATNSAAFIERIGFPGTRAYVLKIIERYEDYRQVNPL
jgi:soluble lytic murein transglycosylase